LDAAKGTRLVQAAAVKIGTETPRQEQEERTAQTAAEKRLQEQDAKLDAIESRQQTESRRNTAAAETDKRREQEEAEESAARAEETADKRRQQEEERAAKDEEAFRSVVNKRKNMLPRLRKLPRSVVKTRRSARSRATTI
jgi:TATA-binding protein-associated factor Taf7